MNKYLALIALVGCLMGLAAYYVCARCIFARNILPNGQLLRFLSVLSVPLWIGIGIIIAVLLWATPARPHDSWINSGGFKNNIGEFCCGELDCKALDYSPAPISGGVQLQNGEIIPQSEIMPVSPDGWVICRRPNGTRRCTFAPPQGS